MILVKNNYHYSLICRASDPAFIDHMMMTAVLSFTHLFVFGGENIFNV